MLVRTQTLPWTCSGKADQRILPRLNLLLLNSCEEYLSSAISSDAALSEQEDTEPKNQVACLVCFKPATWEKYGFSYCKDHIPEDANNFNPEAHEMDVIDAFKKLSGLTDEEQSSIEKAWQEQLPYEKEEDLLISDMLKKQKKRMRL